LGHCFYGLIAMILFGVTLKYNEAVFWFAASFAVLALDTTLLALLAAQRWRQTGRRRDLAWCVLWSALAPAWFASGVLAGPLCCLYLLPCRTSGGRKPPDGVQESGGLRLPLARLLARWLVPLLGTAAFLAVSLSQNLHHIQHAEHFQGRTAAQVFQPVAGLKLTARTLVDNLVLGVGAFGTTCPRAAVPVVVLLLVLAGSWW